MRSNVLVFIFHKDFFSVDRSSLWVSVKGVSYSHWRWRANEIFVQSAHHVLRPQKRKKSKYAEKIMQRDKLPSEFFCTDYLTLNWL